MSKVKNKIVIYHGGGYSGCIWEPNAFLLGNEGEFVNLGSTGCHGIKNEAEAKAKYRQIKAYTGFSGEGVYSVTNEKQMLAMCEDFASVYLAKFVAEALKYYDQAPRSIRRCLKLGWYCSKCKTCVTLKDEVYFVNVKSFGGMMVAATDMLCQECFDDGACQACVDAGDSPDDSYYPEQVKKNGCGLCDCHYDTCVFNWIENYRKYHEGHGIKKQGVGVQLNELYDDIQHGEYQYKELCRIRGVNHDNALYGQHLAGVKRIKDQMNALWKPLSPAERQAITIESGWEPSKEQKAGLFPGFE